MSRSRISFYTLSSDYRLDWQVRLGCLTPEGRRKQCLKKIDKKLFHLNAMTKSDTFWSKRTMQAFWNIIQWHARTVQSVLVSVDGDDIIKMMTSCIEREVASHSRGPSYGCARWSRGRRAGLRWPGAEIQPAVELRHHHPCHLSGRETESVWPGKRLDVDSEHLSFPGVSNLFA